MTEKIDSNAGYFLAGLGIGSLIGIFFAPKSGEGTRAYLSKKVKEGSKDARKKARELRARAGDLVDSGKELVNQKKEQIASKLSEASQDYLPEKSKAKGV
ncbi:MAG TPA: YtxH domain-containing protein [Candidatus Acidoferrales bacterium]|nr:YtxH domain-containing protein [Candidatus Acidoferrales bacterium]